VYLFQILRSRRSPYILTGHMETSDGRAGETTGTSDKWKVTLNLLFLAVKLDTFTEFYTPV
jgi:hypothetical protein